MSVESLAQQQDTQVGPWVMNKTCLTGAVESLPSSIVKVYRYVAG